MALDEESESQLFDTLQRKSLPDLAQAAATIEDNGLRDLVCELATLHGDATVLDRARELFKAYPGAILPHHGPRLFVGYTEGD